MKIIIWENLHIWDNSKKGKFMLALLNYLKNAGHQVKNLNKRYYKPDCFEKCDMIVMWGSGSSVFHEIYKNYNEAGIPILIIENGYFNDEYCSFGWGHHYYLPKAFDKKRIELFDIEIKSKKTNKGKKIILADRGHLKTWFEKLLKKLPENKEIVFRPHPLRPQESMEAVKRETGNVNWNEIHSVITDCSAFGNKALLNGVPVFCRNTASYACVGNIINKDTDFNKPKMPKKEDIEKYFIKLANSQYNINEMDLMFKNYMKELEGKK